MTKLKKQTSFELERIHIHFNSIYTNEDMKKAFMKHLENEFNPEPFEFCLKVKHFESTKEDQEKVKLFFEIYDNYITKNSPKEINLSSDNIVKFKKQNERQLNNRNKWISELIDHFDILYRVINSQLLYDVFPRFIRTDLCINTVKSHIKDYTVVENREAYDFPYKDDDFKSEIVTDIDVEFMNRMMEDGYDWELVFSDKKLQMNTFYLKTNCFPNVSFLKDSSIQKFESIIPFAFQECIDAFVPIQQVKKYDQALKDIKCTCYMDGKESMRQYPEKITTKRSNACFDVLVKFPIPGTTLRRGVDATTTFFDKNGNWVRIMKPIVPSFVSDPKDWEKSYKDMRDGKMINFHLAPSFMRFQLTPISENTTKYTYIHILTIFGSPILKKMIKTMIQLRAKSLRKDLISSIENFVENLKKENELEIEKDGYSRLNSDAMKYWKEENLKE
eukprot:gene11419-4586_t